MSQPIHIRLKKLQDEKHIPDAAPSAPWPWVDIQDTVDPIQLAYPVPPPCDHSSCDGCWKGYPQSRFPNWTKGQVSRSKIARAIMRRGPCTIYHVDVNSDGLFTSADQISVHEGNIKQTWQRFIDDKRPEGIRVRALFIENISGPVLQMLGTKFNIEPYFFSSSLNRIPSRYQEEVQPNEGDHITVTLTFLRSVEDQRNLRNRGSATSFPGSFSAVASRDQTVVGEQVIDTRAPLRLQSSHHLLSLDLLSVHLIRRRSGSTIISYHGDKEDGSTSAAHLYERIRFAGVYWQSIFRNSSDPTFVLLTSLWYAIYAWDEALEHLYKHICHLETQVITTSDIALAQELHIIYAHHLHHSSLLEDFRKTVEFVRDTRNPAMDALPDHEREYSLTLMIQECSNLLKEIERLEMGRRTQDKLLKNIMNLVNIEGSKRMPEITEPIVKYSAGMALLWLLLIYMKQIAYFTMIFLPGFFIASIFHTSVKNFAPDPLGTIGHYPGIAIGLNVLAIWIIIAIQSRYTFAEGTSIWHRFSWPYVLLRRIYKTQQPLQLLKNENAQSFEKGKRGFKDNSRFGAHMNTREDRNRIAAIFDVAAENPDDLAALVQHNKVQHDNVTLNILPDASIASPTYPDGRTVQCKTANAAYSHAMRVEHSISNALAKSGLHGSYFIQAGFNEELISNGTGTLEEIYIYLDCELSTNSDELTAILNQLGQILAPFPGIVYTIKGVHYILPEVDFGQYLQLAKNAGIYTQGFEFSKNHAGGSSAASSLSGNQGVGSGNSDDLDSSEGGSSGEQRDMDRGSNGHDGGGDGDDDDDDDDDDDNGSNDSDRYRRPKRQDPKNLSIPFQSRVTIKDVRKTPLSSLTVSAIADITLVESPRHMESSRKNGSTSYPNNWHGPWFGLQIPFVSTNFTDIDGSREDPYHLSVAQIRVNASSCPCSLLSFSPQDTSSTDDAVKVKSERKTSGGVSVTLSALPGAKLVGSVGQVSGKEMIERKWKMMTFPCFGDSGENWVMWKYVLNEQHHDAWAPTVTFEPGPKVHFGNKLRSRRPQLEVELVMYWSAFNMSKKDLPFWLRQWFTRSQGKEDPKAPGGFSNMLHQVSVFVDLEKLTSTAWVVGLNKIDEAKQSDIEEVNLSQFEPVTVKVDSEDRRLQCEVVLQRALHGKIKLCKEDRMSDQPLSPLLSQNNISKSRKVL